MMLQILILGNALLAQSGPALYGAIPEGIPTFNLVMDGEDLGAVALVNGRDWWEKPEADALPAGGAGVRYVPDTPWQAFDMQNLPRLKRGATLTPEIARIRIERLRKEWDQQGYTFVETPGGEQPVRKVDIDLAKQAHADAERVAQLSAPENIRIGQVQSSETSATTAAATPAWRGYLGHIALVIVALIAGAVIVKVLIIGSDDGWERVG